MTQMLLSKQTFQTIKPVKKKSKIAPTKIIEFPSDRDTTVFKEIINEKHLSFSDDHLVLINEKVKEFSVNIENMVELSLSEHKTLQKGHISKVTTSKSKGSELAMSVFIPTPLIAFKDEFLESCSTGLSFKIGLTTVFSSVLAFSGWSNRDLINGLAAFFVVVIIDAILGILPNTVKGKKAKKEHTLQAKLFMFIANTLGLCGGLAIHLFLSNLIPDPKNVEIVIVNVHYGIFSLIASIYFYRIVKYIVVANNTKVPAFLNIFFKSKN